MKIQFAASMEHNCYQQQKKRLMLYLTKLLDFVTILMNPRIKWGKIRLQSVESVTPIHHIIASSTRRLPSSEKAVDIGLF
jgi:hypothetical protein